jgi:hypothetical protein
MFHQILGKDYPTQIKYYIIETLFHTPQRYIIAREISKMGNENPYSNNKLYIFVV